MNKAPLALPVPRTGYGTTTSTSYKDRSAEPEGTPLSTFHRRDTPDRTTHDAGLRLRLASFSLFFTLQPSPAHVRWRPRPRRNSSPHLLITTHTARQSDTRKKNHHHHTQPAHAKEVESILAPAFATLLPAPTQSLYTQGHLIEQPAMLVDHQIFVSSCSCQSSASTRGHASGSRLGSTSFAYETRAREGGGQATDVI